MTSINVEKIVLYYSQYEYPVFTVMDEPSLFNNDISKPGLYYLETDKYFPLRGNGWYSQAMVNYCISEKIIELENIKYVIYSSLSIPGDIIINSLNF